VLHRLDYNTSGLLLFGKRRDVVPGVAALFRWARAATSSSLLGPLGRSAGPPGHHWRLPAQTACSSLPVPLSLLLLLLRPAATFFQAADY
jgi:hypothetical protein